MDHSFFEGGVGNLYWDKKFVTFRLCMSFFGGQWLVQEFFLTSQNRTWIVDSTNLIFFPMAPLAQFFLAVIFSVHEFFGNYPTPSPLKNNGPSEHEPVLASRLHSLSLLLQVTTTYDHLTAVKIIEATNISQVRTNNGDSSTVI